MKIKNWQEDKKTNHHGKVLATKEGVDVIECLLCGFKHIVPFSDKATTEKFYSDKFYSEEKKNYISNHQKDKEWWLIEHNEKYDMFEEHLNCSKRRKILDIGSGPGFFLKAGNDRGWDTTGVEPGKVAFHFSKHELKLKMFNDYFSRETYQNYGLFDVVHLNNVLEHINNPLDLLKMAREILLPGGLVCVTSPNDFNPLQELAVDFLKKDQWWVSPGHHVNYFNMASLRSLMIKAGYSVSYESASFPLELFLLMGEDYIGDNLTGQNIHAKRMRLEKIFSESKRNALKRSLYASFAENGLGREITIIATSL